MSAIQHLITEHLDIWTAADTGQKSGRGRSAAKVYGISKLRELILELAVRGKLVPQDSGDEPASELLKRIQAEKAKPASKGRVGKDKPLAEVKDEEKPFDLPHGWEWVHLPDVSEYKVGKTPSTKNSVYWANPGDGFNWVSIADLNHDGRVSETSKQITDTAVSEVFRCNPAPAGTILMSFKLTLGKISILGKPAFHNEAIISIYPSNGIFKDFLFKVLPARAMAGNSKSAIKGNTLNSESIAALMIPLPPLAEQHRIVAKVDELMALCDQLEAEHNNATEAHEKLVSHLLGTLTQSQSAEDFSANWKRIATHFDTIFTTEASIDALKQTLLQLAVMGKLVPQDPNDEPASELLKRIQAEKARQISEGKIKKEKLPPTIMDGEQPFELPFGWEWVRFNELTNPAHPISYGVLVPGSNEKDGVPFVRIADLKVKDPADKPEKSISKEIDSQYERTRLVGGEILMGVVGSIGKLGIVPDSWKGANIARAICRIKVIDLLSRDYVILLLQSRLMKNTFMGDTKTLAQPTLNIGLIRLALTPLPPIDEQHRIVAKVDELMTLCDHLKSRLTEASLLQQKLADVLVENSVSANVQPMHTGNSDAKIDQATARTLLATEVVHQLNAETRMGRVKLQKVVNLAEYVAGLKEVASEPLRNAAGPHDRHFMDQVLQGMKDRQWYEEQLVDDGKSYQYRPLAQAGQHRTAYDALWSPEQRRKISDLIALMRSWKTDQCERVATLYSAWNDLLIEGKEATEANILNEVLNRWNDSKRKFTEAQWQTELTAMKKHALLIPTGFGRRTTGGTQTLSLH